LVTSCIAIFTSIYLRAGNKSEVLVLTHNVAQGQAITRSDLAVVRVSYSSGLAPIPVDDLSAVLRQSAVVPLLQGTLLSMTELTAQPGPGHGDAIVGIATKPGQLPAEGVAVGASVDVILTGSESTLTGGASDGSVPASPPVPSGDVEVGAVLAPNASVIAVSASTDANANTTVVSVLIPSTLAPLVASASAAGQVALVLVGSTP
jgi:hypothetical protein